MSNIRVKTHVSENNRDDNSKKKYTKSQDVAELNEVYGILLNKPELVKDVKKFIESRERAAQQETNLLRRKVHAQKKVVSNPRNMTLEALLLSRHREYERPNVIRGMLVAVGKEKAFYNKLQEFSNTNVLTQDFDQRSKIRKLKNKRGKIENIVIGLYNNIGSSRDYKELIIMEQRSGLWWNTRLKVTPISYASGGGTFLYSIKGFSRIGRQRMGSLLYHLIEHIDDTLLIVN